MYSSFPLAAIHLELDPHVCFIVHYVLLMPIGIYAKTLITLTRVNITHTYFNMSGAGLHGNNQFMFELLIFGTKIQFETSSNHQLWAFFYYFDKTRSASGNHYKSSLLALKLEHEREGQRCVELI